MLKELLGKRTITGEKLYQDPETKILFERCQSGFSWPAGKQSFVLVLGQEFKKGELHILYQGHERDITGLAHKLGSLCKMYPIPWWSVDRTTGKNKVFDELLYAAKKDFKYDFNTVNPQLAPDLFLVREVLNREFRTSSMKIPEGTILHEKIKEFNRADPAERGFSLVRFPEIMVLSTVIFEFPPLADRTSPYEPKPKKDPYALDDAPKGSWLSW